MLRAGYGGCRVVGTARAPREESSEKMGLLLRYWWARTAEGYTSIIESKAVARVERRRAKEGGT